MRSGIILDIRTRQDKDHIYQPQSESVGRMHFLIYTSEKAANALELEAIAEGIAPDSDHEICYTVKQLHKRLSQPRGKLSIALMNISRREEIDDIVLMNPFLSDLQIVIILPDRDKGTISKAHLLSPRFLTYSDHNLSELEAVLAKMISRMG